MKAAIRDSGSPYQPALVVLLTLAAAAAVWAATSTSAPSDSFLPHGFCYRWNTRLLTLHVVSDSLIFFSYLAISVTLLVVYTRYHHRLKFRWLFVAFGAFILACGLTHLLDVVVLWKPLYWLAGQVKLVTATASAITAVALPFIVPGFGRLLKQAETSRVNEKRFLAACNSTHECFYILECVREESGRIEDFRFLLANENGARLVRSTPAEVAGKLLCATYPVNRTGGFFEKYKRVVETGEPLTEQFSIQDTDVDASWLEFRVTKLDDGVAISTANISERKRAEQQVARSLAFTRSLIAHSPFAVIAVDCKGTITEVNPAAECMLGYARSDLAQKASPLRFHLHEELVARAARLTAELSVPVSPDLHVLTAKASRGLTDEAEWTYVRKDGSRLTVQLAVTALDSELSGGEDSPSGWMCIAYDITERKRSQSHISHLAYHDSLTDLPNRALLNDRLQTALDRARRSGEKVGLLLLDLDDFKQVNDSLGHSSGDLLLTVVGRRLTESVRKTDTVARLGGDEFVVLLEGIHSTLEVEAIRTKLLAALATPLQLGGQDHIISASAGMCLFPDDAHDQDTLLSYADAMMYRAKAANRRLRPGMVKGSIQAASISHRVSPDPGAKNPATLGSR